MPRGTTTASNNFEKLLGWIGPNENQPGEAYEQLRSRLIKIFYARGCHTAEELADETIERVTRKIDAVADSYEGDPRLYFFGVAKNVFREYVKKPASKELPVHLTSASKDTRKLERHDRCLSSCLKKLTSEESEFILDYYKGERSEKIENRQKIMESLDITPQALRVRAYRVRAKLQKCVFACLDN